MSAYDIISLLLSAFALESAVSVVVWWRLCVGCRNVPGLGAFALESAIVVAM